MNTDQIVIALIAERDKLNAARKEEEDLIRELQVSGPRLLNGLRRHRWQTDERETELRYIHRYCDLIISSDYWPSK
jgi:hypothetical protein